MKENNDFSFITVWIIVKNEEKHIVNTLKYLTKQTFSKDSFEIIIVDWNSSDNTKKLAKDFLDKNDISFKILNESDFKNSFWINYWHSWARNIVLKNASFHSKYIAWIDADCRADKNWLTELYHTIKNTPKEIVWAWWPRFVETTWNISKKELVLNYYFTSCIMSLRNPAFCDVDVKYMPSIAWYNSIYKKEIFDTYMYDTTYPFNTDDLELNFRLSNNWYRFLKSKKAIIYHRIDNSIISFLKSQIAYWLWAWNTMKLHKRLPRIYIPIAFWYFLYTIFLPILVIFSALILKNYYLPFVPYLVILFLSFLVFLENIIKTKSIYSLYVFLLVPSHLFFYGYGFSKSLMK